MKYLLYCIFHSLEKQMTGDLAGVDDQPVLLVSNNGISAAVSIVDDSALAPDLTRILVYKNVIESFHLDRTLIPMRYGCLLEEEEKVVQLLKKNRAQYEALLKELDGCAEMGIRVLISECGMRNAELKGADKQFGPDNSQSEIERSEIRNPKSKITGRAYLAARKTHYDREDNLSKEMSIIIDRYRETFSGLYVKFKTEHTLTGNSQFPIFTPQSAFRIPHSAIEKSSFRKVILSLYFLVRRKSVESFRQAFRQVVFKDHAKLLLSGPWPPFNFVQPDRAPGLNADIRTKPKRRLLNGAEWG